MRIFSGSQGTRIHYPSDLSGDVTLFDPQGNILIIPGQDLREFVERYLREPLQDRTYDTGGVLDGLGLRPDSRKP